MVLSEWVEHRLLACVSVACVTSRSIDRYTLILDKGDALHLIRDCGVRERRSSLLQGPVSGKVPLAGKDPRAVDQNFKAEKLCPAIRFMTIEGDFGQLQTRIFSGFSLQCPALPPLCIMILIGAVLIIPEVLFWLFKLVI